MHIPHHHFTIDQAIVAELIKGEFEEEEAQAIAAALAKICDVKKPADLAYLDIDKDVRDVAEEAKLGRVGVRKLAQIIASKATPKAANATPAAPIVTPPPPPPPDHRLDLLSPKVRPEVYEAAMKFALEVSFKLYLALTSLTPFVVSHHSYL